MIHLDNIIYIYYWIVGLPAGLDEITAPSIVRRAPPHPARPAADAAEEGESADCASGARIKPLSAL